MSLFYFETFFGTNEYNCEQVFFCKKRQKVPFLKYKSYMYHKKQYQDFRVFSAYFHIFNMISWIFMASPVFFVIISAFRHHKKIILCSFHSFFNFIVYKIIFGWKASINIHCNYNTKVTKDYIDNVIKLLLLTKLTIRLSNSCVLGFFYMKLTLHSTSPFSIWLYANAIFNSGRLCFMWLF